MSSLILLLMMLAVLLTGCAVSPQDSAGDEGGPPGPAPSTPSVVEVDDALVQDAMSYAADQGIELEEAIERLQIQDSIGDLEPRLRANESETFAGLWIQHQPEFRIVVQFTRDGEETVRSYIEGEAWAGLVEVREAPLSLAELEAAQAEAGEIVAKLNIGVDSGINVMANQVELYVLDPAALEDALEQAGVQLPDGVVIVQVDQLAAPG